MTDEQRPGWLETLWNVNPSIAEQAENYLDEMIKVLALMKSDLKDIKEMLNI